jgi:hypothetical protein
MTTADDKRYRGDVPGPAAVAAVGGAIAVAFVGSALVTPRYVIYERAFGFSQVTLVASVSSLLIASVLFAALVAVFALIGLFIETSAERVGRLIQRAR